MAPPACRGSTAIWRSTTAPRPSTVGGNDLCFFLASLSCLFIVEKLSVLPSFLLPLLLFFCPANPRKRTQFMQSGQKVMLHACSDKNNSNFPLDSFLSSKVLHILHSSSQVRCWLGVLLFKRGLTWNIYLFSSNV